MYEVKDSGERQNFDTGARRDTNEGKGAFHLLPSIAVKRWAVHMEKGAAKYGENNWLKGMPSTRYMESLLRHAFAYLAGDRSEDHMAAILFNAAAIMQNEEDDQLGDMHDMHPDWNKPEWLRENK